jgi:hypothetical protein
MSGHRQRLGDKWDKSGQLSQVVPSCPKKGISRVGTNWDTPSLEGVPFVPRGCPTNGGNEADALPEVGPPPCDGCYLAARCKAELLACGAFRDYVDGVRWRAGPRTPTHEGYRQTFASEYVEPPAKPAKRRSAYAAARLAAIAAGAL